MITKPNINSHDEYNIWRKDWKESYRTLSEDIRRDKQMLKSIAESSSEKYQKIQRILRKYKNPVARKMNQLLVEVKTEWQQKRKGLNELRDKMAQYPLTIKNCRTGIFHFNKGHLINPQIPPWIIMIRGELYHINHVEANIPWTTRETPDNPTTKGAIRFKNADISIDKEGNALITENVGSK